MVRVAPILLCSVFVLMVIQYYPAAGVKGPFTRIFSGKSSGDKVKQETGNAKPTAVPASSTKVSKSNSTAVGAGTAQTQTTDQRSGDVGGGGDQPEGRRGYYENIPQQHGGGKVFVDLDELETQKMMASRYGGGGGYRGDWGTY